MKIMKMKGRRIAITTGLVSFVLLALAAYLGWPHIVFWHRFESLGPNAQGFPEYRHRQTGIVTVKLPGGKFWMGAQKTDPKGENFDPEAWDCESPVHQVKLHPFLIGKYEVTQAQWKAVMGSNPSIHRGDDLPVDLVSWVDIQEFEAKTLLSLPSEAEWEYACRADTTTPFAGTGKLEDMGWYRGNRGETIHPVGMKHPNGFGIYDMHGNVEEWCEDVYDKGFYGKPEAREPDPVATGDRSAAVLRGGHLAVNAGYCRSSHRNGMGVPTNTYREVGFRVAYPSP